MDQLYGDWNQVKLTEENVFIRKHCELEEISEHIMFHYFIIEVYLIQLLKERSGDEKENDFDFLHIRVFKGKE